MFKQVKVVYHNDGENVGTQSPICAVEEFNGDLTEQSWKCVSYDNDIQVQVSKYEVKEIWLPEWLEVAEYCARPIDWKFLWAYHKKASKMSEVAQRALLDISGEMQYWLVQLVASDTRTAFRTNIKEQVLAWCEKRINGTTPYAQPLSQKQMSCITGNRWNYTGTANGVSRSNNGVYIEALV